jgi:hypothetical protein
MREAPSRIAGLSVTRRQNAIVCRRPWVGAERYPIAKADELYDEHLTALKRRKGK